MKKEFHLTQEGVDELKKELEHLKGHRGEIAEKLKIARSFGDLTENSEYHSARDEQVALESRIAEIEHILKNVEVIKNNRKHSAAELGATVTLKGDSGEVKYTIVGSMEADPLEDKISDESPIGKAILGKKVGEEVTINLPAGEKVYKVTSIS